MERALIVCDAPKATDFFKDFLKENGYVDIVTAESGPEAMRYLNDYDIDICLVNSPLGGKSSESLSIDIAEKNVCQTILFVKAEVIDEITEKVENYGVITVSKPINKQLLWSALKLAKVAQRRITMAHKENDKLRASIEDLKTISHAKVLLVATGEMTEPEAHKYIERQAMDLRLTKVEVAKRVIEELG